VIDFKITLDRKLSKWVQAVKEGLGPVLENSTMLTASYGTNQIKRSTAHGRTGKAQASWNKVRIGFAAYKIYNPLAYVKFLETGTGIYGPKHRRLEASELTQNGRFFRWPNYSGKKSGNKVTSYSYATFTNGMPAQPAIEPNVEKIQKDLNIRTRNGIRKLYKLASSAK
jgi:hypothetical protein